MAHDAQPTGPDLRAGVALADVPSQGVLAGHVDGEAVLLARLDDGLHAVGGACTHYGAPLAEGLVANGEIHCPWHHACFSLRTGAALKAPAFAPLSRWKVETVGDRVFVRERDETPSTPPAPIASSPQRIVIVGGGAAGFAAAERLRVLGFDGTLTMLSADRDPPCDRPNLSKDYLAGTAPAEWIPLRDPRFYPAQRIDLRLDCEVDSIDLRAREVRTMAGERHGYDRLLLATGAMPLWLSLPGFNLPNVHCLGSLSDAGKLIADSANARRIAVVGAGFIGLEAAGALRARGLEVHVVAPEPVPMARLLGPEIGRFLVELHARNGVNFHLGAGASGYDGRALALANGESIDAGLLLVGIGVVPRARLAEAAGLAVRNGILVDAQLRTSAEGIYAAGDVARYPHGHGDARIEHWVHAQRQGQLAAANMLGGEQAFDEVPFFWTHHHGLDLRVCGYLDGWDEVRIDGNLQRHDFIAHYLRGGRLIAAASIGRDRALLEVARELRAAAALTPRPPSRWPEGATRATHRAWRERP
jgi:NADPH-dependent 2,4-dienoyl-CoA reductase/sulfur reductase-like enzyme/nitrite reductase/ring-hydroxylating ferredoxin subunit